MPFGGLSNPRFCVLLSPALTGVRLITSDAHAGLRAARQTIFGGIPWQRCQFHLQQNARAHVPRKEMHSEVAQNLRTIFDAPDLATAETWLKETVQKYQEISPRLANWMEQNIPEGLAVFAFPTAHRRRIRTSNMLERLSQEIRRRTRVVRLFPNEASCLRLVTAVLMETREKWQTGKIYLSIEPTE